MEKCETPNPGPNCCGLQNLKTCTCAEETLGDGAGGGGEKTFNVEFRNNPLTVGKAE